MIHSLLLASKIIPQNVLHNVPKTKRQLQNISKTAAMFSINEHHLYYKIIGVFNHLKTLRVEKNKNNDND